MPAGNCALQGVWWQVGCILLVLCSKQGRFVSGQPSASTTVSTASTWDGQYSWREGPPAATILERTGCGAATTAIAVCSRLHKVVQDDTLSNLAERFNTTVVAIIEANPGLDLSDPTALELNTRLQIPPCDYPDACAAEHFVKPGESLEQIAKAYQNVSGVSLLTVDAIMGVNKDIKHPNEIFPSQRVKIPLCDVTQTVQCSWAHSASIHCNGTYCDGFMQEMCIEGCSGTCAARGYEPQCCRLFNLCIGEQRNGRAHCALTDGLLYMHFFPETYYGEVFATCNIDSSNGAPPGLEFVPQPVPLPSVPGTAVDESTLPPETCGISQVGGVSGNTCQANITVSFGDDVDIIASKYGTTPAEIARVNPHIADVDLLVPGDRLSIPPCDDTLQCASWHFADDNEGLWQIGQRYNASLTAMQAANPEVVQAGMVVLEGQAIRVPPCNQTIPHECKWDKPSPIACSGLGCATVLGPSVFGPGCLPGNCSDSCSFNVNEAVCCKVFQLCLEQQQEGLATCYATAQGWFSMSSSKYGGWTAFCDPTCIRFCFMSSRWACCSWSRSLGTL